jgi:hypothetical protein
MQSHSFRNRSKIGMVVGLTLFVSLGLVQITPLLGSAHAQLPAPCTEGTVVVKSGNGAIGTTDPNVLFSTDGGATFTQQAFIVSGETLVPFQYDTIPGTEYVAIDPDRIAPHTDPPFVAGTSIPQFFQTTFQVPQGCSGAILTVAVNADNVATVFLNGTQIGAQADLEDVANFQNPPDLFTSNGPFLAGVNTLTFKVGNYTNKLALDFEASICCSACNDQNPPSINCSVTETTLWPPNHQLVNVGLAATVTDDCDSNVVIGGGPNGTGVSVYSDEPDLDILGSGNFSPDAKNIALGTLRLRSERSGNEDGRVYLIVVQATDASGKTGFCTQTVTVTHDQSKASEASVAAQAAAAQAFFLANHVPPPGFVQVGIGPIVGPKQ